MLQVIPNRHPVTINHNNNFSRRMATWNVRIIYQSGKTDNIIIEMRRLNISILRVCEVRWTQSGKLRSEGTTVIYLGGILHKNHVGIFLDEKSAKSLCGFWYNSDKVTVVKLKGRPFDISVIQCYAPTADSTDEEVEKFYDQLDEAMK